MQRVKAHDLRSKDEGALVEELTKHRKELAQLRVSKVSSQPQVKLSKIRVSNSLWGLWCLCWLCSPSEKLSPVSWRSFPRSASPPPVMHSRARNMHHATCAKRRPAPSAKSWPLSRRRSKRSKPKRSPKTLSNASMHLLPEFPREIRAAVHWHIEFGWTIEISIVSKLTDPSPIREA